MRKGGAEVPLWGATGPAAGAAGPAGGGIHPGPLHALQREGLCRCAQVSSINPPPSRLWGPPFEEGQSGDCGWEQDPGGCCRGWRLGAVLAAPPPALLFLGEQQVPGMRVVWVISGVAPLLGPLVGLSRSSAGSWHRPELAQWVLGLGAAWLCSPVPPSMSARSWGGAVGAASSLGGTKRGRSGAGRTETHGRVRVCPPTAHTSRVPGVSLKMY